MSISINNNVHNRAYQQAAQKNKFNASTFFIPFVEEAETSSSEISKDDDIGIPLIDENGIIRQEVLSKARMLPPDIINGNRLQEFIENNTAKIVFEFGQGGSIRIKEGLSQADYLRAKSTLRDIEFWRNGGTSPR